MSLILNQQQSSCKEFSIERSNDSKKQKQTIKTQLTCKQANYSKQQLREYAKLFAKQDFLGKYYADRLDKMIYFKFNNKDYNKLKINDRVYRFFSGFFIDRSHFDDITAIKYENIMKSFSSINFVDYNSNVLQSFGNNNKGSPQDPIFSSNYDSANLFAVIKKQKFEYDLILQNDTNSKGNNQWFNFLVNFTCQGTYKFNIVNFTKRHSLYEQGMRISCFSFKKQIQRSRIQNSKNGSGWFKGGKNISYLRNDIQREGRSAKDFYYTLSFEYCCHQLSESIMFASTYPYANLELEKYFNKTLFRRTMGSFKMDKIFVCNSIAGQPINGYLITHKKSRSSSYKFKNSFIVKNQIDNKEAGKGLGFLRTLSKTTLSTEFNQESNQLKSIILMARQHPGEAQSSYILEGIVDFLMSNSDLDQVKKGYVFYVFPMVNVDGVKYGNYRTNLCGFDLNRNWRIPRKQIHPQVYYLKKLLYEINRNTPISLILDIHGHSRALNSFFYGNPSKKDNNSFDDPKFFPFFCSKRMKQISFKQSTFSIKEDKKNSARVVLGEMFPKALVYTFQNSFYGYVASSKQSGDDQKQKNEVIEYTCEGYRKVGRQVMSAYLQYRKLSDKNSTIKGKWMRQMSEIFLKRQKLQACEENSDDGGSNSEIEEEPIELSDEFVWNSKNKQLSQDEDKIIVETSKPLNRIKTSFVMRKSQKKKTMPIPKTKCDDTLRGMSSHSKSFKTFKDFNSELQYGPIVQNKQNPGAESPLDGTKKPQYPQAVLSIFKIDTNKNMMQRKKTQIKSISGFQQSPAVSEAVEKRRLSPPPYLLNRSMNKVQKQFFQPLFYETKNLKASGSQQKLTIQQAVNKFSGMKTFFKTVGMTIESRKT